MAPNNDQHPDVVGSPTPQAPFLAANRRAGEVRVISSTNRPIGQADRSGGGAAVRRYYLRISQDPHIALGHEVADHGGGRARLHNRDLPRNSHDLDARQTVLGHDEALP